MLVVDNLADAKDQWINEQVKLLTVPRLESDGKYTALAIAYGMLCFVEVSVKPHPLPTLSKEG